MYKNVSKSADRKNVTNGGWKEALVDAERKYEQAEPDEKRRLMVSMGTIRQAINRGEPWPVRVVGQIGDYLGRKELLSKAIPSPLVYAFHRFSVSAKCKILSLWDLHVKS